MKYELYCIYDRVAGFYSMPQAYPNKGTAVRQFNYVCSQNPDKDSSLDYELYFVGYYDSSSAVVEGCKPVFVQRFGGDVSVEE